MQKWDLVDMLGNKGVSEITGALLVIVVMLTASGIIYVISYPTITNGIENLEYRNTVKNLLELREIVERVRMGVEPSAEKEIPLGGGSLYVNKTALLVSVNGRPPIVVGNIEAKIGSKIVAFETGIYERSNPIPISEPVILKTPKRIYVALYNFTGNFSAGGEKTRIHIRYAGFSREDGVFKLVLYSAYCENWKRAFESAGVSVLDYCPNNVTISSPSNNISIGIYNMVVS